MSLSPSSILERMEKLKRWQEDQEKLMQQHHIRLQANNSSEELIATTSLDSRASVPSVFDSEDVFTIPKPKRPFLRRGSGLCRFKMAPGEQFKSFPKVKSSIKTSNKSTEVKLAEQVPEPISKPKGVWSNLRPQETNASLLLFEAIENKLKETDMSGSSYLHSSTPQKDQSFNNKLLTEIYTLESAIPTKKQLVFVDENLNRPNIEESYEDIIDQNKNIINDNRKQMAEIEEYERRLQEELLMSLQQAIKFKAFLKQDKSVGSSSPVSSIAGDILTSSEVIKDFNDREHWNSNCSFASTSSTVSSSDVVNCRNRYDVATMTEESPKGQQNLKQIEELQKRLQDELVIAQEQSKETKQLKKELEQQRLDFEKQKRTLLKQVDEEKSNIARTYANLEEDRKKLAKDKMVFERYIKDAQNRPNKREREEITFLKDEISAVTETFKLKEVKNSTTQARLRNQIKHLEKENSNLKTEIERLTREYGKLVATQRLTKKPTDTKLLHEINKNLTKLAQDQLNKLNEVNYEKQQLDNKTKIEKENNKNCSNFPDRDAPNYENKNVSNSSDNEENIKQNYDVTCVANCETASTSSNRFSNRCEEIHPDGSRVIKYSNGNMKMVSSDGNIVIFKYHNGDVKTTNLLEGTISYSYCDSKIQHTTKADGTEVLEYPDGQTETRLKNGTTEIKYSNGINVTIDEKGDKTLLLPNGQKEIHTNEHKRREYPDGTVKLLYPDGRQETRYSNGRVRIKDNNGTLLFDSMTQ